MSAPTRRRPGLTRRHVGANDACRRRLERYALERRQPNGRLMNMPGKGSGSRALKVRVKGGKSRKLSSKLWLDRQLNDPYVARAKREGMRSRAAYKLSEIDDKT